MCFTINVNTTRTAIEKRFNADTTALRDFGFKYFYRAFDNPLIPVITQDDPGRVQLLNWGLIPGWAGDAEHAEIIRKGTYNARSESLDVKASFKSALHSGRCLVIARGFFEWQHLGKEKIPWYISKEDHSLFSFAGLYDTWYNEEEGRDEMTFTIVTTAANQLMEKIHNTGKRMPVILSDRKELSWLEKEVPNDYKKELLLPYDQEKLHAHTISKALSSKETDPNDEGIIDEVKYFVDGKLF